MAIPPLQALHEFPDCTIEAVYTQPDRPVGRKKKMTPSPVRVYAESLGLPIRTPERAKAPEVLEELQAIAPKIIVVCAYGQILPKSLLAIPEYGCFNLHYSLLPRWRGASPIQAALQAGDAFTGVALQKTVFKLDAGPLVACSPHEPIHPTDTSAILGERLSRISAELLTEHLSDLLNGTFSLTKQDENQVTFCRIIKKEEGLIQWNKESAEAIERKLRAFTPWPGIYTFDQNGKRLQLTQVEVLPEINHPPGVIQLGLIIGTQSGSLRILALKPEGKREMQADEFLRGYGHLVGTPLGK